MTQTNQRRDHKTLHTNRHPSLGFGLGLGLFDTDRTEHVIVRAAVGEFDRHCAYVCGTHSFPTGEQIRSFQIPVMRCVSFSPGGTKIAVGGDGEFRGF